MSVWNPESESQLGSFLNHVVCGHEKALRRHGIEFHRLSFFLPTTTVRVQETYTFLLATGSLSI